MAKTEYLKLLASPSSKGQVDLDILISYVLFAIFIFFLIEFVIDLINPYVNFLDYDIEQKQVLLAYELGVPDVFNSENFASLCNVNVTLLQGTKVTYTALGFTLPAKDEKTTSPETTSGEIILLRKNKNLEILAGSNSTSYNVKLEFVYPEDTNPIVVKKSTAEGGDFYNLSRDSFKNNIVTINTTFANDLDEFEIKTDPATKKDVFMVFISTANGINKDKIKIGAVPMNNSCRSGKLGEHSEIIGNSLMIYNGTKIAVKIDMETWWLR